MKETSQSAATHCCLTGAHTNGPAALPPSFDQPARAVTITEPLALLTSTPEAMLRIANAPPANKGSTYLRCCVLLI